MKVQIFTTEGSGHCDDCGYYSWETAKVLVDGDKLVLDHTGDDHLGGGRWYDWQDAVREILTALGHEVEIIEVDDGSPR